MKRFFTLLMIGATCIFQSCTTDSIADIEAEMEIFASDNKYDPDDPKELPDEEDEG